MLPGMIVDEQAEVLENRTLSAEYNVVALGAASIAAAARPGQFVMVKTRPGLEPLLRRPFSIFEILRAADGTPRGISILNKRIGTGTGQLFDARVGDRLACLGPLGQPWPLVDPPTTAWMVAGGVGLAPFATLTEASPRVVSRCASSTARGGARISTTPTGSPIAASISCWRPKTAAAARMGESRCRWTPRSATRPRTRPSRSTAAGRPR